MCVFGSGIASLLVRSTVDANRTRAPWSAARAARPPGRGDRFRAAMDDEPTRLHGGRLIARRLKAHGVTPPVHALRRPPVLDLRGLPPRGHRDRRHPPRGDGRVRRRGLGEGHARAGRRGADRRPGRDQRHERDGLGAAEPLADGRARRPRARVPLGPGLAAGDRPRAVRAAGGQARRHRGRDAGDPRAWSTRRSRSRGARTPGRCSSTSRSTSCSSEADAEEAAEVHGAARRAGRRRRARPRAGAARRRRAAGDHGRHEPLLGPRRGGAAGAGRGARHPGVPERPRRAAACPPTTRWRSRGRARRRWARPTSRSSSACRWTSGSASARRSATRREIVAIDVAEPEREHPRAVAAELYGDLTVDAVRARAASGPDTTGWVEQAARDRDRQARGRARAARRTPRAPLHPMRVYGELAQVLDRDAIVIGDGGDFVSFAGRVVDSYDAGLLAGPRPVRLPRLRPGLRAGGQARAPRPPGRAAARRRRVRLLTGWSTTRSPATASTSSA